MNLVLSVIPISSKSMTLCLKIFLCIYNLIFMGLGLILVVVGLVGMGYLQSFLHVAAKFSLYVQIVFILSGVALFGFGLLGTVAALLNGTWMLRVYSICLFVMFLLELVAGIAGYICRAEVQRLLATAFKDAQHEYTGTDASSAVMDSIQGTMGCCGLRVFSDWKTTTYFTASGLPTSCCVSKDKCSSAVLKDLSKATTQVHKVGCLTLVTQVLTRYVGAVAGAAIGIGFFQLIGVTLACCLSRYVTHSFFGMPR